MFKKKELEKKLETYQKKLKNLKNKNKELQNEKRELLKEKKKILDKHGDQLKNLIEKMSDGEMEDISEDTEGLIERLESEIFDLKEEVEELNRENEELIEELNEYEAEDDYALRSDKNTLIPERSEINGGIKCKSDIEIGDSTVVHGPVESSGDMKIGDDVTIEGPLEGKSGEIDIGARTEILGKVRGSNINLGEKSQAENLECFGDVILNENSVVSDVIAVGNINMMDGAKAEGKLKYGKNFDGGEGISIVGSVMPLSKEEIEEELKEKNLSQD
ncbi:MAG: polymer-forming cytoskeletal protein [Candidatus Thermoplasmatota archaeon]|nr:polymer-forming cytoskeletal protein [Candidatus Thermoplasmatota archaeon]MBS3789577.1 polymer-forming cytoskeletal protein [Candidatus Thermoplasmatota archaeon]